MEKLYSDYYGFIFKYLLSLCRDEGLAQELTQEAFFRAYINMARLRDDEKAVNWLLRIARNLYFSWYNEQKKLLPLEDAANICDRADIAEDVAVRALSKEAMDAVARLDEPYKEVFMLAVFGQIPLKDISATFGKSESWARVTFYRAKQRILEIMR